MNAACNIDSIYQALRDNLIIPKKIEFTLNSVQLCSTS